MLIKLVVLKFEQNGEQTHLLQPPYLFEGYEATFVSVAQEEEEPYTEVHGL